VEYGPIPDTDIEKKKAMENARKGNLDITDWEHDGESEHLYYPELIKTGLYMGERCL
jgi:hypothetical protein